MANVEILELHYGRKMDFFLLVIDGKIEFTKEISDFLCPRDGGFYEIWTRDLKEIQNLINNKERSGSPSGTLWSWKISQIDEVTPSQDPDVIEMLARAKLMDFANG